MYRRRIRDRESLESAALQRNLELLTVNAMLQLREFGGTSSFVLPSWGKSTTFLCIANVHSSFNMFVESWRYETRASCTGA